MRCFFGISWCLGERHRREVPRLLEEQRHQLAERAAHLGVEQVLLPQPVVERALRRLALLRVGPELGEDLLLRHARVARASPETTCAASQAPS